MSCFCLETLPLSTSSFGLIETVFEKSRVFNLVDSKLASAFDGDLFGFERLKEPNEFFVRFFLESTVIKFLVSTRNLTF